MRYLVIRLAYLISDALFVAMRGGRSAFYRQTVLSRFMIADLFTESRLDHESTSNQQEHLCRC